MKTKHKKNNYNAAFNSGFYTSCPCINHCPVKPGKKAYYLRYDDKAVRLSVKRAYEKIFEF